MTSIFEKAATTVGDAAFDQWLKASGYIKPPKESPEYETLYEQFMEWLGDQ